MILELRRSAIMRKRCLLLGFVLILSIFFSACGGSSEKQVGPEVGKWHADYKLSDIDTSSMSDEDRATMALLSGNVVMGIDAEFFEDGSFSYSVDTDQVKEGFSKTINSITSWFLDFDISIFTDRIIEAALRDVMSGTKMDYLGDYTKSEDGLIMAVDEDVFYFRTKANRLIQIDSEGNDVLIFSKVEN